ncbi:MAG: hypothetical protein A2506_06825 [Elusimicrobia bacterium RIFOXYD12_FULL_66_9]|nr:MAG: hypothetical protein A2506_06825 [Elusimicrobia bacterium RIFOXYD12_FULL_66_9]
MKISLLGVSLAVALSVPASSADLDELLPPRQEAPTSAEAGAPKGPRIPGMPPGRSPMGPRDERPPDPALKEMFDAIKAAEEKVRSLAPRLREGSETQKSSARAEARRALGELFDAKLGLQEFELGRLEKRSSELKAKIARKKLSREKAIDERLAKMGGDDDWE